MKKKKHQKTLSPADIFGGTHPGLVRENNEDSYIYCADERHRNSFVAVADGIGGHDSGDIASKLCLKTLLLIWRRARLWNEGSLKKMQEFLKYAIYEANSAIYRLNLSFNIQHPMGTTIVAAVFMPSKIIVAHAGDSRCYRLKDGKLDMLTRDHSFVEELIIRNIISRDEAKDHPFSHIISRCVGTSPDVNPEVNVFDRNNPEKYIFCSDGLVIHLESDEIKDVIAKANTPQDVVRTLLYNTLKKGGEDNITVLAVSA